MISGSHLHLLICTWFASSKRSSRSDLHRSKIEVEPLRGAVGRVDNFDQLCLRLEPFRLHDHLGIDFLVILHFLVILVILGLVTFDLHNHPLIGFWCKVKS